MLYLRRIRVINRFDPAAGEIRITVNDNSPGIPVVTDESYGISLAATAREYCPLASMIDKLNRGLTLYASD